MLRRTSHLARWRTVPWTPSSLERNQLTDSRLFGHLPRTLIDLNSSMNARPVGERLGYAEPARSLRPRVIARPNRRNRKMPVLVLRACFVDDIERSLGSATESADTTGFNHLANSLLAGLRAKAKSYLLRS
jgi:hypothetical protein